ncbi:hypothetical protein F5879DRAFT_165324 [Lentinula edodes]|nr:hypothetical protein F5879DRAFT_165324 [Lentinula edodes]
MEAMRECLILAKHLPLDALPLVPFRKWTQALSDKALAAESGSNGNGVTPEKITLKEIPAAKILEFIRGMANSSEVKGTGEGESEALGGSIFGTENIQRISKRMRELAPIGRNDAGLWVKYWIQHGL